MTGAEAAFVGTADACTVASEWIVTYEQAIGVVLERSGVGLTLAWWISAKRIGADGPAVDDVVVTRSGTDKAVWMRCLDELGISIKWWGIGLNEVAREKSCRLAIGLWVVDNRSELDVAVCDSSGARGS